VAQVTEQVPISPDDLPEYAGAPFDGQAAHPDVMRLATWHRLAQRDGRLSTRFTAPKLLMLTINTASMRALQSPENSDLGPREHATRRATVVAAVRRLVEP
jgi:hypothetical protein